MNLDELIIAGLTHYPKGISGMRLWNRVSKESLAYSMREFDRELTLLVKRRVVIASNKKFWLNLRAKTL